MNWKQQSTKAAFGCLKSGDIEESSVTWVLAC